MNPIFFITFYTILLALPCGSMEKAHQPEPLPSQAKRSRSTSENSEHKEKFNNKKLKLNYTYPNDKLEILNNKSKILISELPKLILSFKKIEENIKEKIRINKNNFNRASELASLGGNVISLSKTASLILNNVSPMVHSDIDEKVLLNASLAIIGSGALKDHIEDFIDFVSNSTDNSDNKDIDLEDLKLSCEKIKEITNDIQIRKEQIINRDK